MKNVWFLGLVCLFLVSCGSGGKKNPDLKIGYVPVPAEALAREEMPAWCSADSERGIQYVRHPEGGRYMG